MGSNYRAFFARKWSQVNRKETYNAKTPIKFPPFEAMTKVKVSSYAFLLTFLVCDKFKSVI